MERTEGNSSTRVGLTIPDGEIKLVQELIDAHLYGSVAEFYSKAGHRLLEIHGKLKTVLP